MSPRRQSPLTNEYILLGFLHQQSGYGYDIYKELNGLVGLALVWHVKQSQLYALLDKLEMDGLLKSAIRDRRPTPGTQDVFVDGRWAAIVPAVGTFAGGARP